jgi:hypothetical protein
MREEEEKATAMAEKDAPDAYLCPIGLCLLNKDPVVASDGFVYSRAALELWIKQRQVEGRPLTSPKTNAVMDTLFLPNHTHKILVQDWFAAWRLLRLAEK